MSDKARSYRNTALLAISSVINVVLAIIRNKIFALYLGPAGIGQFGILNDFTSTLYSLGSLGINNSGVQAVSKASTQGKYEVRRVYNTLVYVFTALSVILVIFTMLFAGWISERLIADQSLALFLRIASVAVLLRFRASIQSILITGTGKVSMLAKGVIWQGVLTTLIAVVLVITLKGQSVPFLIISLGLGSWVITYYQSRKVVAELPATSARMPWREFTPVILLGVASLWASLMEATVTLFSKSWIAHYFSKDHLGYYQVAIGFTGMYISFITASISSDYYPRLVTKVEQGTKEVAEAVNEQISISMALIMPLLFIMLTFSKLFIIVFFSKKFLVASGLIGYNVAGTFIQVIAWPIAYVFLARRATKTYMFTETVGNLSMLVLSYFATRSGNFAYMGLAYVLHYVVYLAVITVVFYRRFNGYILPENIKLFFINASIIALIIIARGFIGETVTYIVGSLLTLFYFYFSRKEYSFMINTIFRKR
jgi:enterobacterial common antigen flippase